MSGITRLITDRDILAGSVSSPIVLDAQTLLTPAARDRAVQKGYVIVERGAAGGDPGRPGTPVGAPPAPVAGPVATPGACSGGACPRCASAAPCACQGRPSIPPGLPDGLYLVRVFQGQVQSVLPAAGPGLTPRARPSEA